MFASLRLVDDQAALFVFNRAATEWKAPALEGEWKEPLTVAPKSVKVFFANGAFKELADRARALAAGRAPTREIRFVAKGLSKDDEIRVVGSGPELGAWRPENGLKLSGASGVANLPVDGVFEFKLAVKTGTGPWRWQSGENQVLQVTGSQQVELQWRENGACMDDRSILPESSRGACSGGAS